MQKLFHVAVAIVGFVFFLVSCDESSRIDYPGDNGHNLPDRVIERWWDDSVGLDVPRGAISVAQAVDICKRLFSGVKTLQYYYIKGLVFSLRDDVNAPTKASFWLVDDPSEINSQFQAYRINNYGNKEFTKGVTIFKGNWVVIYGQLTNYNGTYETASGTGSLYSSTYADPNITNTGSFDNPFTVEDVVYIDGSMANKRYFVKGYVVGVSVNNKDIESGLSPIQLSPDTDGNYVDRFRGSTHYLMASDTVGLVRDTVINGVTTSVVAIEKLIAVSLPMDATMRDALKLNVVANTRKIWHKEILVYGILEDYLGINGVTGGGKNGVSYLKIGDEEWGERPNAN